MIFFNVVVMIFFNAAVMIFIMYGIEYYVVLWGLMKIFRFFCLIKLKTILAFAFVSHISSGRNIAELGVFDIV